MARDGGEGQPTREDERMKTKPNKARLTRCVSVAMIIRPPVLRELSRISRQTNISQQRLLDMALKYIFVMQRLTAWLKTDWSKSDAS